MEKILYVCIEKKRYRLYESWPGVWRLFHQINRCSLGEFNGWPLDYWRNKGVIEGEEEKEG